MINHYNPRPTFSQVYEVAADRYIKMLANPKSEEQRKFLENELSIKPKQHEGSTIAVLTAKVSSGPVL